MNNESPGTQESKKITVGFAMCGSFCTFAKAIKSMKLLSGYMNIIPIMSHTAAFTDTRFGNAANIRGKIEEITEKKIITTIMDAEPIGPRKMLDILLIAPCTGNTLGKLASGITDTTVTMAAKAHLRNAKPLLIAVSTNDALSASAKNIGYLINCKNIFFVPMNRDDPIDKPTSLIADFGKIPEAIEQALRGKQL